MLYLLCTRVDTVAQFEAPVHTCPHRKAVDGSPAAACVTKPHAMSPPSVEADEAQGQQQQLIDAPVAASSASPSPAPACDGQPSQQPSSLSWRLWCGGKEQADRSLHHPFVQGIATGALSKSAFQHYLIQDYVYLQYFQQAYELTIPKCDRDGHAPEVRQALEQFVEGVKRELGLHTTYCASWGVDLRDAKPSPTTTAYTDFLLEVAKDDSTGVEVVLAAMAPCARLYAYLACQLALQHPQWRASPYARWVESYSGSEYLALPALKERLLDGMEGRTDYALLSRLYNRAMELEFEFFDAQPL